MNERGVTAKGCTFCYHVQKFQTILCIFLYIRASFYVSSKCAINYWHSINTVFSEIISNLYNFLNFNGKKLNVLEHLFEHLYWWSPQIPLSLLVYGKKNCSSPFFRIRKFLLQSLLKNLINGWGLKIGSLWVNARGLLRYLQKYIQQFLSYIGSSNMFLYRHFLSGITEKSLNAFYP